jgi:hypothetical protein
VPAVNGFGFSFDGTDYVQVPDAPSLDLPTALTIDAWIDTTTGGGRIVDKITPFANDGYLLDVVGRLRMQVGGLGITSQSDVPLGTFVHVAGTYDGTRLALYVNGQLDSETTFGQTPVPIPVNALPLRIGADSSGGSLFTGVVDDPRIFNRALTANEVNTLFVQGTTCQL